MSKGLDVGDMMERFGWVSFAMTRVYAKDTAARRSNQVLALRNGYHGRSFGAVALTGNASWRSSQLTPFAVHFLHGTDRELPAFARMSDTEYI